MLKTDSGPETITPRSRRRIKAADWSWWLVPSFRRFVFGGALGVGVASFLITELMHYVLVPDLGRHQERVLAEGLSAFIVSCLIAKMANVARQQPRLTVARMQVIEQMNHHITSGTL